jgi:RNA polymerase sigma-70 factor (ECF subfamily)
MGTRHSRISPSSALASSAVVTPSLVRRLQSQDSQAWRRLVFLFGPVVYAWCRRGGLQEADAADVRQEVFHVLSSKIGHFRREGPGSTFRGWLWTITHRKILDHQRRRAGRPVAIGGSDVLEQIQAIPARDDREASDLGGDAAAERAYLFRRAAEAIRAEFETRTWQAFYRVAVENQSAADVAADLGMSKGAVYVAKSRVLRRLREELADLLDF